MNANIFILAISLLTSTFAISGINFDHFIKRDHIWEARFLSILMIFALSYLVMCFFTSIIEMI